MEVKEVLEIFQFNVAQQRGTTQHEETHGKQDFPNKPRDSISRQGHNA